MNPIPEDKIFSLDVLIYHMVTELDENAEAILQSETPSDIISKIVDGHVPFENHKLAGLLIDDLSLGYPYRKADKNTDVFKLLKWTVYERLNQAANQWQEQHLDSSGVDHHVRSYN